MYPQATTEKSKNASTAAVNRNMQGHFFAPSKVQPKLIIGSVNNTFEREADSMAEKVINTPRNSAESNSFFKPASPSLQTKCSKCEDEENLQMKSEIGGTGGTEAPSTVHDVINSSGHSLDPGTRNFFEPRFGQDFSQVKIHTDSKAAQSAQNINALAYTSGNNIVFNQNQFSPESDSGKKLLAHELTHVVQQNNAISRQIVQRYPWPYSLHLNKEVKENVSETISNAPAGSEAWNGTYNWDSLFRIELNAMFGEVWMIVRLSSPAPLAVRQSWERAIERKWSNRMYLRVTIPGTKQGPCKFLIKADIRWVTDPAKAHHTITPKNPGDTCNGRVGLNDTCSMTDWGTGDTTDITHEFGHMLGNPEDYFTTNGHNYATGGKAGFRDPGGGVMNNPAERAHRRHFNLLREQVAKMLQLPASNVRVIYNNEAIPDCAADIGDFPEKSLSQGNASV